MKSWNCVLYVGTAIESASDDGNNTTIFFLTNEEIPEIEVVTTGVLAASALKNIVTGKSLRIVGRLAMYAGAIVIMADTIAYIPE
jgi:hypothetical protein